LTARDPVLMTDNDLARMLLQEHPVRPGAQDSPGLVTLTAQAWLASKVVAGQQVDHSRELSGGQGPDRAG
jgi:hypothetical protein